MGCSVKTVKYNFINELDSKQSDNTGIEMLINTGIESNFTRQSTPTGKVWKGWSAKTIEMRNKRQGHYVQTPSETNKKNVWTANMKDGNVISKRKLIKKLEYTVKNQEKYSGYANRAREFQGLSNEYIDKIIGEVVSV